MKELKELLDELEEFAHEEGSDEVMGQNMGNPDIELTKQKILKLFENKGV